MANWKFWQNKASTSKQVYTPVQQVGQMIPTERSIKRPGTYIVPVQLKRLRQDVLTWRAAIDETEQAWFPQRVKMQQLYQDTVLNGHVDAAMTKRKNLTLLKEFTFQNSAGEDDEALTEMFRKVWFRNFMEYVLDAKAYGYSLIAFGDLVNDNFPGLQTIRRYNISADRYQLLPFMYSLYGKNFLDPKEVDDNGISIMDWTAWVDTPSESGINKCGNGYLYKVALYEIFLRNVLGQNGDFVELYAQPYRVGKTDKTEGPERDKLEQALQQMGSSGYAILDPQDQIEFLETALGGTGYKGYESLEKRCEEKISKIILGHGSALDKTPGELGGSDAVADAIRETQKADNRFFADYMNEIAMDKFRNLGFNIPFGTKFVFKNNEEEQFEQKRKNEANKLIADTVYQLKLGGVVVDKKWLAEETGWELVIDKEGEAKDKEVDARAALRGSVGGVQGIIGLQQSVAQGLTEIDAAVATLVNVYGYDDAQAKAIIGNPKVVVPVQQTSGFQNKVKNKLIKLYGQD